MRRVLLATGAAAAFALTAGPAAAVPPVHDFVDVPPTVVEDSGEACGFPVRWTIDLEFDRTRFFDEEGNLVRVQLHITEENTIENLESGLVLREGPDSFMQTNIFEDGRLVEIQIAGLAVNVFGEGLKDVGRVVAVPTPTGPEIVFSGGPHPVREAAEGGSLVAALSAFCEVLAG